MCLTRAIKQFAHGTACFDHQKIDSDFRQTAVVDAVTVNRLHGVARPAGIAADDFPLRMKALHDFFEVTFIAHPMEFDPFLPQFAVNVLCPFFKKHRVMIRLAVPFLRQRYRAHSGAELLDHVVGIVRMAELEPTVIISVCQVPAVKTVITEHGTYFFQQEIFIKPSVRHAAQGIDDDVGGLHESDAAVADFEMFIDRPFLVEFVVQRQGKNGEQNFYAVKLELPDQPFQLEFCPRRPGFFRSVEIRVHICADIHGKFTVGFQTVVQMDKVRPPHEDGDRIRYQPQIVQICLYSHVFRPVVKGDQLHPERFPVSCVIHGQSPDVESFH